MPPDPVAGGIDFGRLTLPRSGGTPHQGARQGDHCGFGGYRCRVRAPSAPLVTRTHRGNLFIVPDPKPDHERPEFEDVVAALLKVDPDGISGKATKKKAAKPKN
jgi:hypothetical protein